MIICLSHVSMSRLCAASSRKACAVDLLLLKGCRAEIGRWSRIEKLSKLESINECKVVATGIVEAIAVEADGIKRVCEEEEQEGTENFGGRILWPGKEKLWGFSQLSFTM